MQMAGTRESARLNWNLFDSPPLFQLTRADSLTGVGMGFQEKSRGEPRHYRTSSGRWSKGVRKPSTSRGLSLISSSTARRPAASMSAKLLPFG